VLSGGFNDACSEDAVIGGGLSNGISGMQAFIGAGVGNASTGDFDFIGAEWGGGFRRRRWLPFGKRNARKRRLW
jgi:hypothetical protein